MADVSAAVAWALNSVLMRKTDKTVTQEGIATISRVDKDGTVWLSLPGSTGETPANGGAAVAVSVGDAVRWTIRDGRLFVTGNTSSPSVGKREVDVAVTPVAQAAQDARGLAKAAKDVADATAQHFWHDDNGAHVSSEAGNATGAQNSVWNSLGMLFRNGANNLLALVTGNSPGVLIYDGRGNAAENVTASMSSDGVMLGLAGQNQTRVAQDGIRMTNAQNMSTFEVNTDVIGAAMVTETFRDSGSMNDGSAVLSGTMISNYPFTVDITCGLNYDGPLSS